MSHTKENWRVTELDRVIADRMEKVNDDYFIADCFGPDAKENARRIVACVNACQLIPTEWLEKNGAYAIPTPSVRDAIKERDTYRDLCSELTNALHNHYWNDCTKHSRSIEALIYKAKSILGEKNGTAN